MEAKSTILTKDLHARPATMLIQKAGQFNDTKVWIEKEDKKTELKSLISILAMGLKKDCEVVIRAEGSCENDAVKILISFIEKGFPEDG